MQTKNLKAYLTSELKELGVSNIKNEILTLKDLKGNEFYFMSWENGGYLIFDPKSCHIIERSEEFVFPYDQTKDNYYLGPLNYYIRKNGVFKHLNDECGEIGENDVKMLQETFDLVLFLNLILLF